MSVWTGELRALTIGLVLTITLVAFEGLAVATIMPAVRADLGGTALYGWVFSAFMLASVVSTVLAGRAADTHGVGRPFAFGLLLFGVGLVLDAVAPSMLLLVVGRAVQGFGAGAVSASAVTTVARGYPEVDRPRVFALMSSAWVVPSLAGPAVSGVVADSVGWRWVFAGLLPLIAVSGAIAFPRLRTLRPQAGGAAEVQTAQVGIAVALAIAVALLLTGLDHATGGIGVALAVLAAVAAAAALRRLLPPGTLRARRGLPAAVLTKGVLTFAFFGTDAFVSLAMTSVRHRSIAYAGLPLTAAALTWTAGAWISARATRTITPQALIRAGFSVVGAGIAVEIAGLAAAAPAVTLIAGWAVAGLGMGIAYQTVTLAVLAGAEAGREGAASAAQQLTDLLGVAVGTGVVGAFVAVGHERHWSTTLTLRSAWIVTLVTAIAGAVLAGSVGQRVTADMTG